MKRKHRLFFVHISFCALLFFLPSPARACNTSGFIIDNIFDNGDGTVTIEMTILVAGGNTTVVGSTWGFYWNLDVPILSISPFSITSSNGTTLVAAIVGNTITWGDPEPSAATPFLDINASPNDEHFQVTIIAECAPTEWSGGGQEANICPNGGGAISSNYMGEFSCGICEMPTSTLELMTCDGGTVLYAGMVLDEGSMTDVLLTTANGCDSLVTVTVTGLGPLSGTEALQACEGQPTIYQGTELLPGTTTDFTLTSADGCDSVVTVTVLDPVPPTFGSETLQGCEGEILTYHGVEVIPGPPIEFILTNAVGCDSIVTLTVLDPLPVFAAADTFELCLGASLDVAGLTITEPGVYPQTFVAANGCDSVYTAYVQLAPGPPLGMPPSVEIELGDELVLRPSVAAIGQINYMWQPDPTLTCPECPNPTVIPFEATTYFLTITDDEGCLSTGSVEILVRKTRRVYIPNSFSPNGDGINDVFMLYTNGRSVAHINRFEIFSRWGERVFENFDFPPGDFSAGWDGHFLGEPMNSGIFVYAAEVEFIDGEILTYRGDVLLVR